MTQAPQCLQMIGFLVSSSKKTAFAIHALSHRLHPMHLFGSKMTPPPALGTSAPDGHASTQAISSMHPRHTVAKKRPSMPPEVLIFIALLDIEWFFWLIAEQTSMQLKHPMHLFMPSVFSIFPISYHPLSRNLRADVICPQEFAVISAFYTFYSQISIGSETSASFAAVFFIFKESLSCSSTCCMISGLEARYCLTFSLP